MKRLYYLVYAAMIILLLNSCSNDVVNESYANSASEDSSEITSSNETEISQGDSSIESIIESESISSSVSTVSESPIISAPQSDEASSSASLVSDVEVEEREDLEVYDLAYYTQKFWEGDTVYHDSICFVEQEDGSVVSGTLLYTPYKVISVRSNDLKTVYTENVDYTVQGNRIILTENSRIKILPYNKYCTENTGDPTTAWLRITGTDKCLIASPELLSHQVFVTYTHSSSWEGMTPEDQADQLPRSVGKLENKEELKIVFYGDSITAGWDASGQNETVIDVTSINEITAITNRAPYMPAWAEMVTAGLKTSYGYDSIIKVNKAAGGSTSFWGKQHVQELVVPQDPDLVIIAFGMNEALLDKTTYKANISEIMDTIHASNPDAEFLLVSCMMPNRDSVSFAKNVLKDQEDGLYELQSSRTDLAIGVVPVHSMFLSMHEIGKLYTDYSSNNINHPNDFAVRIYAQMILTALGS